MKFLLALDVAKDTLAAVLKEENGRTLFPAKEFADNTRGFAKLLTGLTDPKHARVIFEATGVCTKALIHALDGTVCRRFVRLISGVLKTRKPFNINHNAT